jgi:hypothetical protein
MCHSDFSAFLLDIVQYSAARKICRFLDKRSALLWSLTRVLTLFRFWLFGLTEIFVIAYRLPAVNNKENRKIDLANLTETL